MRRRIDRFVPIVALPLILQTAIAQAAASCEDTVKLLDELYNNTSPNCMSLSDGSVRNPASNCTGVYLRAATRPETVKPAQAPGTYDIWDTSPNATKIGTTAASWMRADVRYDGSDVGRAGMLLYPPHYTPAGKTAINVACAYPIDGFTDSRSNNGCGDNSVTPKVETSCAQAGVTGANWKSSEFDPVTATDSLRNKSQCSFEMRGLSEEQQTEVFQQFLEARASIDGLQEGFVWQTEVRYDNIPKDKMPVMAFFNDSVTPDNIGEAWKNADDYERKTGERVPVIQIEFPKAPGQKAKFTCPTKPAPAPYPGGWGTGSDPKQCAQYVKSVQWVNRTDPVAGPKWTLVTEPTDCGRQAKQDQTDNFMAEMKEKALAEPGGAEYWENADQTMRRQLVCHFALIDKKGIPVRDKQTYNLEPFRPYVSHEESLAADCNPVAAQPAPAPAQCPPYIKSVRWVERRDFGEFGNTPTWSLEVTPNECARGPLTKAQTDAMKTEVWTKANAANKAVTDREWSSKNKGSIMNLQLDCLKANLNSKATWNIEPRRLETDPAKYKATACNPPDPKR